MIAIYSQYKVSFLSLVTYESVDSPTPCSVSWNTHVSYGIFLLMSKCLSNLAIASLYVVPTSPSVSNISCTFYRTKCSSVARF